MTTTPPDAASTADYTRLVAELEQAELYEQRLRGLIVAVRDQLANGNAERALSMLNAALNEIDSATDVVTRCPHDERSATLARSLRARSRQTPCPPPAIRGRRKTSSTPAGAVHWGSAQPRACPAKDRGARG